MVDNGLLAQRIRWARKEQGITLQQLSERSGRAVSYLSQLEHGVKDNPTRQTVESLAQSLGVRPAFLFGEVSAPDRGPGLPSPSTAAVGREFRRHVSDLPAARRSELAAAEPSARFTELVSFLVSRYPETFTHIELAFQLNISYAYYREILELGAEVSHYIAEQLARVSGVAIRYITHGSFEEPAAPMPAAEALHYVEAIRLALEHRLSPDDLKQLILAAMATR